MTTELITNPFIENTNRQLLRQNIRLLSVLVILVCVYAILELINWYLILDKTPAVIRTGTVFFVYKVHPYIAFTILGLQIFGVSLFYKGSKLIKESIENENAELFNQGYGILNRYLTLSITSLVLALISILITFLLKAQSIHNE